LNVTPLSLGIETLGGVSQKLLSVTQPYLPRSPRYLQLQLIIRQL